MRRTPKALMWALALVVGLASILVTARPVAAAQNHPTWTQGDFWLYTRTQGSTTSTIRVEVLERTTLTLALGTYSVFHVTTTTTNSTGSSVTIHSWVRDSDLGTAKTNFTLPFFGDVQVTFDPPLVQAQFPLSVGASWALSTTIRAVNLNFNLSLAYSASVIAEQTTAVAAGSFTVAVIQSPATQSGPHNRDHYSEGAGNHVRRESYDANGNRVADQQLTSYKYQSGTLGLLLIGIGIAIVAVFAIAVLVTLRRRRARGPPPGMYPPGPPPEAPPPP